MDITCWNCKTITTLDKTAIEAAIAQMDTSKLGFHDVICASCGKVNRTARDVFAAGLQAFAVKVAAKPVLNKREATKKNKGERKAKRAEKGH